MRFFMPVLALAFLCMASCRFLGCFTVSDACHDCCKNLFNEARTHGADSKTAWMAMEPCEKSCKKNASRLDKDGEWVEKHEACTFDEEPEEEEEGEGPAGK